MGELEQLQAMFNRVGIEYHWNDEQRCLTVYADPRREGSAQLGYSHFLVECYFEDEGRLKKIAIWE